MDHSYYRDKISAYSDGALEAQERELIRRHLEDCAECRTLLEKLFSLSEVIEAQSGLKDDEYFEGLASKIEKRISQPSEKVVDVREFRWKSLWWKVSAAAATLVLVGTIGFYQYKDDQEMPAKVLDDFRLNQVPVAEMTDTVSVNEETELQGGRSDNKESAGKIAEAEKGQEKKEKSDVPVREEKDEKIEVDEDLIAGNADFATKPSVVSQPSEQKAKVSAEELPALEAPDVGTVVVDKADESMMFEVVSDSIVEHQLTLAQWRSQRDSIQSVLGLVQDTIVKSMNYRLKELAAPSVSSIAKVDDSFRIYQDLANSWYQIALQTPDNNEKERAIQFLNWYKNRFPSDSSAVNVQLRQISK